MRVVLVVVVVVAVVVEGIVMESFGVLASCLKCRILEFSSVIAR